MIIRYVALVSLLMVSISALAQVDDAFEKAKQQMQQEFANFNKQAHNRYDSFRKQCNKQYADFLRMSWDTFLGNKPEVNPLDTIPEVEPVVVPVEERKPPVEDTPVPQPEIVAPPDPQPDPEPVEFVLDPEVEEGILLLDTYFNFYGARYHVSFYMFDCPHTEETTNEAVARMWEELTDFTDGLIRDCLQLREQLHLCDWAYLQMVEQFANAAYENGNESIILQCFVLAQSGYDVLLGRDEKRDLHYLIAAKDFLYHKAYWLINNKRYYCPNSLEGNVSLEVMREAFPKSSPMRIAISREMTLASDTTESRILRSKYLPQKEIRVTTNKNLIDFYNTYPEACDGGDPYTKWRYYAETPLCKETRNSLYPALKELIADLGQKEAANLLLGWVQTAFEYGYDDTIWGRDRAFFGEETLFYPFSDCEDRSILFSHLMRDLLDLDVLLIYYPGHLATAVRYTDSTVHGDYILYKNQRYYISDPTATGSYIGQTMEGMNNAEAVAIPVRKINY